MKKYWRIYRDSYSKLKDYPARTDIGNLSEIYKEIQYFDSFYICNDNDPEFYSWMPLYHMLYEKNGQHSDKPGPGRYNSIEFFDRQNYKFSGEIGGRKQKLQKLKWVEKRKL